jgi:hypothetical protein
LLGQRTATAAPHSPVPNAMGSEQVSARERTNMARGKTHAAHIARCRCTS